MSPSLEYLERCSAETGYRLAAEHADEPSVGGALAQQVLDELVLANRSVEIHVRPAGLFRQTLDMLDDALRLALGLGHEVRAAQAQDLVHERRQPLDGAEPRQMSLEDDPVEPGERTGDEVARLGGELSCDRHGVLLHCCSPMWSQNAFLLATPPACSRPGRALPWGTARSKGGGASSPLA